MNIPAFNPPAPGAINIRTFQDLRRFLLTYIVNQWMQYSNNYFSNQLVPLLNTQQYSYGQPIASAANITPNALVQQVTGTATVTTIHPMATPSGQPIGPSGPFYAISRDGFVIAPGGNINISSTVTVPAGGMAVFAYDGITQKWSVIHS